MTQHDKITFLNLTRDRIFKTFFRRRKDLLISLMESFLPLPKGSVIESVSILNTELHPDKTSGGYKLFVLDLRVKLKRMVNGVLQDTEIVNVEVQTTAHKNFTDRLLAYSSRLYADQLKEGDHFNKLLPVYSLVFTTENLKEFENVKDYCHVCNIRRIEAPEVVMSKGMCFVIVELDKFCASLDDPLDVRGDWCYLLKNSSTMDLEEYSVFKQKGGVMAEAAEHLWVMSQDETLQEIVAMEQRNKMDQQAREQDAHEEGLEKGLQKGRQEGRQEGQLSKEQDIISNMLKNKMDIKTIAKVTESTEKKIREIQKKLNNLS